ncbi:MAG: flavodoxin domain-containing protein, partial [Chloroflexi bacterium]|nr:flavodoxin domain-containing protein [Chloroflexota bacterium]
FTLCKISIHYCSTLVDGPAAFEPPGKYANEKANTINNKILVTYASRVGSTAGVAEAIGKTLSESGEQVDVLPMQEVKDLTPYRAVVAGSAIQNKQWLPEAMQFLQAHQSELARKPFAAFLVCMTLAMRNGETYRPFVAEFLARVRALVRPVSEGYFSGTLDIRKVPSFSDRLKFRLSVLFGVWAEGDHRDWNAIRLWAESLAPLLHIKGNKP